jgi:Kef-type K+ transport system membrane component KefB
MHHAADILLTLFLIFIAAQIGAEIAQRLKLPGVVGEIAAGCVVGPSLLGWLTPEQILPGTPLDVLAELGVVLLLFSVGLETRLGDLKKVGKSAFLVGVLGVLIPFGLGALWAHGYGFDWIKSLFVAAAFVATSAGITARVLQELGVLSRVEARVILGAAVIDDILAMLLLGVVSSLQGGGELNLQSLLLTLGGAIGFVAIIGAFLAGMIASETRQREDLEHKTLPLLSFLTPFFFVVTGAKVDLSALASVDALVMLAVVTVIAIVSKLAGGFLGALSLGKRSATIVGFGMVPRGEVGVVIASLGLAAGVFNEQIYAIIVAMSLLTDMVTPPVLAMLLKQDPAQPS